MATPVNRPSSSAPQAGPSPGPAVPSADGRLYLRDQELDQGAALIRAAARRLSGLVQSLDPDAEVAAAHLDVLEEVLDRGPMDVKELRGRLHCPKQTLNRYLNQLEAAGLTRREASQRDRRRRLVTLTEDGRRFAVEATLRRRAALRQAFLNAGPDAVTGARRVLQEVLRS